MNKENHLVVPNPNPTGYSFNTDNSNQPIPVKIPVNPVVATFADTIAAIKSDIIILNKRKSTGAVDIISNVLSIITETEANTVPILTTVFTEKHIPMQREEDEDCIAKIGLLGVVSSIQELLITVNEIKANWDTVRFIANLSSMLSDTIIKALKYRYEYVGYDYIPYLTSHDKCTALLEKLGVRVDIEAIILYTVNTLFGNCNTMDNLYPEEKLVETNPGILAMIIKKDIIVLPGIYSYLATKKQLYSADETMRNALQDVYQQAFNSLDESLLSIDVYDAALNHYIVWRLGRKTLSPNRFEIEQIS